MKVKDQYITDNMALYNGDSCEVLKGIPDSSIHFQSTLRPLQVFTHSATVQGISATAALRVSSMNTLNL